MKVKQDSLTDFDMLLMVKKGIRGGICHAIHRCAKANKKYFKNYAENRESPYLNYWDANMDRKKYMDGGFVTKLQWR